MPAAPGDKGIDVVMAATEFPSNSSGEDIDLKRRLMTASSRVSR
jgi:hypothetical protein